jgi:hypothetical protein
MYYLLLILPSVVAFTKVVVPSIYREYNESNYPAWISDPDILARYNYSVFLYQKLDPSKPNYIEHNRGTEGAVYIRYIIDHYDYFPDVAVFVHARPQEHQLHWLDVVGCIAPTATYMSMIPDFYRVNSQRWKHGAASVWIEQCWRDLLRVVWGYDEKLLQLYGGGYEAKGYNSSSLSSASLQPKSQNDSNLDLHTDKVPIGLYPNREALLAAFEARLPIHSPVTVNFHCCQQFFISRKLVQSTPLYVWERLFEMINIQETCHIGEPDYEHLYSYKYGSMAGKKVGPEPRDFAVLGEKVGKGFGRFTGGGAMEHLAHVIFGKRELEQPRFTMNDYCLNFLPRCSHSPCWK